MQILYRRCAGLDVHKDTTVACVRCVSAPEHHAVGKALAPIQQRARLLTTIPAVSELTTRVIRAEIGVDMTRFADAGQLVSWAGTCPRNDDSAGERRSTRVRKGVENHLGNGRLGTRAGQTRLPACSLPRDQGPARRPKSHLGRRRLDPDRFTITCCATGSNTTTSAPTTSVNAIRSARFNACSSDSPTLVTLPHLSLHGGRFLPTLWALFDTIS